MGSELQEFVESSGVMKYVSIFQLVYFILLILFYLSLYVCERVYAYVQICFFNMKYCVSVRESIIG